MVVVLMHVELVEAEADRVGRKPSAYHEAVDAQPYLVLFCLLGIKPSVKGHSLDLDQGKKSILAVREYDVRTAGESDSSDGDRRKFCFGRVLVSLDPDHVPVCIEAVV